MEGTKNLIINTTNSISLYERDTPFSDKENGREKYKGSVVGDNWLYFPKNILLSKANLYILDYGFF
jgi:hypothetical protein